MDNCIDEVILEKYEPVLDIFLEIAQMISFAATNKELIKLRIPKVPEMIGLVTDAVSLTHLFYRNYETRISLNNNLLYEPVMRPDYEREGVIEIAVDHNVDYKPRENTKYYDYTIIQTINGEKSISAQSKKIIKKKEFRKPKYLFLLEEKNLLPIERNEIEITIVYWGPKSFRYLTRYEYFLPIKKSKREIYYPVSTKKINKINRCCWLDLANVLIWYNKGANLSNAFDIIAGKTNLNDIVKRHYTTNDSFHQKYKEKFTKEILKSIDLVYRFIEVFIECKYEFLKEGINNFPPEYKPPKKFLNLFTSEISRAIFSYSLKKSDTPELERIIKNYNNNYAKPYGKKEISKQDFIKANQFHIQKEKERGAFKAYMKY